MATLTPERGFPTRKRDIREKTSFPMFIPEIVMRKFLASFNPESKLTKVAASLIPIAGRKPTIKPEIEPKNIDFIISFFEILISPL